MKAGVVMALTAISILKEANLLRPITLLLNSEEEIGSEVSRPITEKLALESSAVFVLEPAQGLALKTARKGVGHFDIHVTGIGAHSGVDFERGHSAILELARQIEKIATFTDLKRGLTVNPGVISGGTRSNVIAAEAHAEIDVRIARASDEKRVDRLFASLKPFDKACTLTITGGINRPPMERKPGTIALFKQAKKLAVATRLRSRRSLHRRRLRRQLHRRPRRPHPRRHGSHRRRSSRRPRAHRHRAHRPPHRAASSDACHRRLNRSGNYDTFHEDTLASEPHTDTSVGSAQKRSVYLCNTLGSGEGSHHAVPNRPATWAGSFVIHDCVM